MSINASQPDKSAIAAVSPVAFELPDLLPARMLNEFVYCPRLFYLEYVQGQFVDSADTIEGRQRHERVDVESGQFAPSSEQTAATSFASEQQQAESHAPQIARSVMLSAPEAGLIARCDLIESTGQTATPVDYKRGSVPDHLPTKAWEADRVQIAAQAIILRENGYQCDEGVVYYCASKTRIVVKIDDALIEKMLTARDDARRLAAGGIVPPPLEDSPKCPGCSLVGICLPDETHAIIAREAGESAEEVRRLTPARDDALPVYVQAFSGSVGKTGDQIYITAKDQPKQTVRLLDVSQLNLFGNIQVSTQAIRELASRGIPICYFSFGGKFQAFTQGMTHKNVELRLRQFEVARDKDQAIQFARAMIRGKVYNCRTLLRRNSSELPRMALRDLSDFRKRIASAESAESLLGFEGAAARVYFQHFNGMLKSSGDQPPAFNFETRNRRPPQDPVNALLSFAYSMLVKELTATALRVGFDPFLGLYHRPKYGRPALALDLAEEFRPLIADSVVLQVLNTGEIQSHHFVQRGPACNLTPGGRKAFINAYERRLDTLVTHPIFKYTISYRRIMEVQARLLAACLVGEFSEYIPFMTR